MIVRKRDNTTEVFAIEKIVNAVSKAFDSTNQVLPEAVKKHFEKKYKNIEEEEISVEEIQDYIEKYLMKYYPCVAKNFLIYRYEHKLIREDKDKLIKEISKKLRGQEIVNANANLDEMSFGGRIGEASRVVTKDYALKYCMSRKSRNNHLNNEIYIHDLDSYAAGMHNCLSCPIDDLLAKGFNVRQTDVRPANSINTAFQLVAVIFQIQSLQQFGGVSATHLDWTMVPYVKKSFYKHFKKGLKYIEGIEIVDSYNDALSIEDEKYKEHEKVYKYALESTTKELKQAVEGMYHNLND